MHKFQSNRKKTYLLKVWKDKNIKYGKEKMWNKMVEMT